MLNPPFETENLRRELNEFLRRIAPITVSGEKLRIGSFKFGVYAFYDYDGEPIYVGQTCEGLSTRIRRHLTNQRTDAVAMKVLDPFEVQDIEIWPLPQYQRRKAKDTEARRHLNWLERSIFDRLRRASKFKAILNEKNPPVASRGRFARPKSVRARLVSSEVYELRKHPDIRLARRAETLSLLAKVISERRVQKGLRRTLLVQSKRLAWLAEQRLIEAARERVVREGEKDPSESV